MIAQNPPPLLQTFKSAWPLFFGVVLLMIGNGLQGTLLALRGSMEGFSLTTTGIVMSMYYVGYVVGSILAPQMLVRVGHIRVFAALATIISATVLLHFVFVDPVTWGVTRAITGFAYAGLYVVIESWLNGMATNKTRGKILSLYMLLTYMGLMLGQLMLNIADPRGVELFVLTSILVSIGLIPICLSRRQAPAFDGAPERVALKKLWNISPIGCVGTVSAGILSASLMTIAPVYANNLGMSIAQVSVFMSIMVFGGMLMQYPVGLLSDRIDRRLVMILCCAMAAAMAIACQMTAAADAGWLFYLCAFLFWGFGTPIYALAASHTNDQLTRDQIVAVSATMIMLNGVGAAFGPALLSALLKNTGEQWFFTCFAVTYALITLYALYRRRVSAPVADEDKGQFVNFADVNTPVSAELVKGSQPS